MSSQSVSPVLKQKYLVVDDEIANNENDKEDFILDIGVSENLALFASSYEEALEIIKRHSDIAICFIDSRIPKNSQDLYVFSPNLQNDRVEWGISLIPQINKVHQNITIVIYSAYVTKTYLKTHAERYNNLVGFFGKPGGIKNRKQLYLEAIRHYQSLVKEPTNIEKSTINQFNYSSLDESLSIYLRQQTEIIKKLLRRTAQDVVDIGNSLIDVKNKLEHGQFSSWLELEFSWSVRTAQRFMRVAETFKSDNLSDLDIVPSALYELSAPSISETASREAIERAKQGETISLNLARRIKDKHKNTRGATSNSKRERQSSKSSELMASPSRAQALPEEDSPIVEKPKAPPQNIPEERRASSSSGLPKQQIVEIVRQPNTWQLGKHWLFCGEPNSTEFLTRLPSKVTLNLAFPPEKNWHFSGSPIDSEMNFFSKYERDLDEQLLLEAIERFIKITTDDGDNISICFMPFSTILSVVHQLGCRSFIAEPDRQKCEAVRLAWSKLKSTS